MAKLADAPDLGSGAARHVGSTPSTRTFFLKLKLNPTKGLRNCHTRPDRGRDAARHVGSTPSTRTFFI